MKIMYCPQCGGKVRSESIGWKCERCRGFIDIQGRFYPYKEKLFIPTKTNADRIRAMDDEQLAKLFCSIYECRCIDFVNHAGIKVKVEFTNRESCVAAFLKYLQSPVEEDA